MHRGASGWAIDAQIQTRGVRVVPVGAPRAKSALYRTASHAHGTVSTRVRIERVRDLTERTHGTRAVLFRDGGHARIFRFRRVSERASDVNVERRLGAHQTSVVDDSNGVFLHRILSYRRRGGEESVQERRWEVIEGE